MQRIALLTILDDCTNVSPGTSDHPLSDRTILPKFYRGRPEDQCSPVDRYRQYRIRNPIILPVRSIKNVPVEALRPPEVGPIGGSFYRKSAFRFDDIQQAGVSADDVALKTILQFVITDFSGVPEFLQGTDKFVTSHIFYLYVYVLAILIAHQ